MPKPDKSLKDKIKIEKEKVGKEKDKENSAAFGNLVSRVSQLEDLVAALVAFTGYVPPEDEVEPIPV